MKKHLDPLKTTKAFFYILGTFVFLGVTIHIITILVFVSYFLVMSFFFKDGDTVPEIIMCIPFVIVVLLELLAIYKYIKFIKKHNRKDYGTSEDAYEIIDMQMKIKDYFEDRHADVEPLLGKPVHIFLKKYYLEFIIYHGDTTNCPNCGAPIPKGQTVCEYCKAPVEMIDGKIIMTKRQMVI